MKSILDLRTLDALIRDEAMATKEYAMLANQRGVPIGVRDMLRAMSRDEKKHHDNLVKIRMWVASKK